MEVVVQLGAGAFIVYVVWQMLVTIFKFFSDAANVLSQSLDNNTDVLTELKILLPKKRLKFVMP